MLHYCIRYFKEWGLEVEKTFKINYQSNLNEKNELEAIYKMATSGEYLVYKLFGIRTRKWLSTCVNDVIYGRSVRYFRMLREIDKCAIRFYGAFTRLRGQEIYDYVLEHMKDVQQVMELLEDDISKETLLEIIRVAVSNDVYRLEQGTMATKYWDCYKHLEDECWVNCGSAVGDTILSYLQGGYNFEKIYAYEGSQSEFARLEEHIHMLPEEIENNIIPKNEFIGIYESENNFNSTFADKRVTLINMDIEGAEMAVLKGADRLICEQRPVLAVAAYHKASDICDIINFVKENVNDYVFYLRKYYGYEPNALNEYVYYAVPKERCK